MAEITSNKQIDPISKRVNATGTAILDAAFSIHKSLGPGLLESVYETCLIYELREKGYLIESQVNVPVFYKNIRIETGLRLDIIVDNSIIIEVKAIDKLAPIHEAQILTYLKLTGHRLGYLINFNTHHLKDGIKRLVL
jgi:GxxExxY protein